MKKILLFLFSGMSTFAVAQSYNGPESIEYDSTYDRWLVANSGNGEIIARANDGTLSVFASGMTTGPYGIEIVGNKVYACDGGRIKGFDIITGTQVVNVNLSATFLNGITHVGTDLFITDFSAKKIYRFNTLNNAFNVYVTGLAKSPNGIIYDADDNRLVFVNWGTNAPVMAVNLADSTTSTLTPTSLGNCDGIAMNCSGQFYVASWSPQRISRFENDFVAAPVNMNVSGLNNPADIFYNEVEDTLGIPNSNNNTVGFVYYTDCIPTSVNEQEKTAMAVYPNPASDVVRFEVSDPSSIIELRDETGRIIFSQTFVQGEHLLNIQELSSGLYFISNNHQTQKLFIFR